MKKRPENERESIRKREKKALMKQLTLAQMSTASMGKFDKKAAKNEPDAPNSQKTFKKKSNAALLRLNQTKKLRKTVP